MKTKIKFLRSSSVIVAGLLISSTLFVGQAGAAEGKKASLHDQFTGQGYGMAGCGMGSVVFGQKPGMIQIFAGSTNHIGSNQSFGLSSGTSNCGEDQKQAATHKFIQINRVALEKDVVRGEGESIAALGQILECKNSDFPVSMKRQYSTDFPNGGATEGQIEALAYKACQI